MLHPASKLTLDIGKLRRKAELALAYYRDAWERNAPEEEQGHYHRKACEAVAALRVYDIVRDHKLPLVSNDQFWTMVERHAGSYDFRSEMRFPHRA